MDGIVIFRAENTHPLAWLLHRGRRHVWCAVESREGWVVYDFCNGRPELFHITDETDLPLWYEAQGYQVLHVHITDHIPFNPFMLRNCVSMVKHIMGIKSWALTPQQLYKHLTKEHAMKYALVPGGGVFSSPKPPAPPPPPPPPPAPPKKVDPAVRQARTDEKKRAKQAAGQGGTVKTGLAAQTPVGDATTTKTLLGQ